jgi:hypothetical protein
MCSGAAAAAPGAWAMVKTLATRMFFIYLFSSMMRQWTSPRQAPANATSVDGQPGVAGTSRPPASNIFRKNYEFDMFMFVGFSLFFTWFL